MRAIVSTKYLAERLKKALSIKDFNKIKFEGREWIFCQSSYSNLSMTIDYTRDSYQDIDVLEIDRMQWYKLLQFVKQLPEQPIVIEISDYGDNGVSIKLSQFVMNF